ncbi:Mediator of RNA polymerase II transcription subunit 27-B [Trichoplax sp. H2]|nr:Mediator of RNA polymerase II transcription subunit 27-B [Trichoplax sp. H2]|eukprot:RDD38711.1 Mediator of RNA polymerase II transcription subunit 27-B [Trichoplax sp. H2]
MNGNSNGISTSNTDSNPSQNGSTSNDSTTVEANLLKLQDALHAIRELRWNVKDLFNDLNDQILAAHHQEDADTQTKNMTQLKQKLEDANTSIKHHLMQLSNAEFKSMPSLPPSSALPSLLLYDPQLEGKSTHQDLINSYEWNQNVKTNSKVIYQIMDKRQHEINFLQNENDDKLSRNADHDISNLQNIKNDILTRIGNSHEELVIDTSSNSGSLVKVTIKNTMTALIYITESLVISKVLVMAPEELNKAKTRTTSTYQVFKLVTLRATSASLHYYGNNTPAAALELFLNWLASYKNLFNSKCKYCNKYLSDYHTDYRYLPPCCRTLDDDHLAYHYECQPSN